MTTTITLAAATLNQTPLDWDGNQQRIGAALRAAREAGVGLLCLPELCITGYGCEDAFHGVDTVVQAERVLTELLPETRGLVACIGLPRLHHRALFNTVAVVADGAVLGFVAKQHLAGDGIHYEPRWFKPWTEGAVASNRFAGSDLPLGDLLFDVGGVRFGFEICEDAWVAGRPGARLAAHGADVILNPSASHFAFGKLPVRHRFVTEGSRAFGCAYVYANLVGNESGRAIYDGGALIAAGGRIVSQGPRLGFAPWTLTTARVDLAAARLAQARSASFVPALAEHPGLVVADHAWPAAVVPPPAPPMPAWESSPAIKAEEFARAEALALFDYLRKSRSQGFVVSLSGGCDSTVVVVLVATMVRLALAELGADGVAARLPHIRDLPRDAAGGFATTHPAAGGTAGCAGAVADATGVVVVPGAAAPGSGLWPSPMSSLRLLTARLLTTVYQGGANSSATTRAAAAQVAGAIGATHREIDIEAFVRGYTAAAAAALGRDLDWRRDDIALQNIQARARAPGVWMITNLEDKLLLATSNRSEAAVGYATMDGDTCGGLSPIAGIDKAFLRQWLPWMETSGPDGLGPMPFLACVTGQRSTPELRPLDAGQVSEEDLMPFPVLDRIERLAIRDKLPPKDILPLLVDEFTAHDSDRLRAWIRRFFTLWARNQWKRERLAPAFHLDDENLDPKTWCRFPILSGGYARELGELG